MSVAKYKNDLLVIETPRGQIVQREYTKGKNKGKVYLRLEWNPGFDENWSNALQSAQARFDEEIIRVTEPYVPMDTGMLRRSAMLASDIGSGEIVYATPYAAAQYYKTANTRSYSPKAGGHWGDRMKADNLPYLENFARGMVRKYGK